MTKCENQVRPEEAGILLVVLGIWIGAILLFYSRSNMNSLLLKVQHETPHSFCATAYTPMQYNRWKKFSGVEPFTPYYVAQVQKFFVAQV